MWKLPLFWLLVIFSVTSWVSWYIIITNLSPTQSSHLAFILFYSTLFFSITFSFSLIFASLWKAILPTKSSYFCLKNGIREGEFIGVIVSIMLFLKQYDRLSLEASSIIIFIALLIEIVILFYLKDKNKTNYLNN